MMVIGNVGNYIEDARGFLGLEYLDGVVDVVSLLVDACVGDGRVSVEYSGGNLGVVYNVICVMHWQYVCPGDECRMPGLMIKRHI